MTNIYSRTNVYDWLRSAKRGASWVYHTGNLQADRLRAQYTEDLELTYLPVEPINTYADELYRAQEQGYVLLAQRRAEHGCDYIAIRTGKKYI